MSTLPDTGLRRMRLIATGLLALMACIFVAVSLWGMHFSWGPFVAAFSEAAMVGALADWFAVTALFRRPLGLPIPHTAVIPRNKDKIGRNLGRFIAGNFLSPEVISRRLREADPALQAAVWLGEPENTRLVARRLAGVISPALAALDEDYVRKTMADSLKVRLQDVSLAPLAGKGLLSMMDSRYQRRLFDAVFTMCESVLARNRDLIRTKVSEKSEWWVPEWFDERLAQKIMAGFEDILRELRDVSSPRRQILEDEMRVFAARLMNSPDLQAAGDSLKAEILNDAAIQQHGVEIWKKVCAVFAQDAAQGADGVVGAALERSLHGFARRLADDERLRAILNRWLERAAIRFVADRREWIGAFFTSVVQRWDAGTAVEKLETQVGRDLQYIRINGTLVGGLVGVALYGVKSLL